MIFIPSVKPSILQNNKPARMFIFSGAKILVQHSENQPVIPSAADLPDFNGRQIYLGNLDQAPCYAAELSENDQQIPGKLSFQGLRTLYGHLDDELYKAAGFGFQILNWDKENQFCSRCGQAALDKEDERAKICYECGKITYPNIPPAIIVAVIKDNQILLARSARFENSKMFSVLAGYLEVGETLEECVKREVMEEVGIEVKNIKYFGSQPWHYSGSMMIGFTAEYAGSEIKADEKEIAEARWFSADNIPEIPGWGSIARNLIDWFCDKNVLKDK